MEQTIYTCAELGESLHQQIQRNLMTPLRLDRPGVIEAFNGLGSALKDEREKHRSAVNQLIALACDEANPLAADAAFAAAPPSLLALVFDRCLCAGDVLLRLKHQGQSPFPAPMSLLALGQKILQQQLEHTPKE